MIVDDYFLKIAAIQTLSSSINYIMIITFALIIIHFIKGLITIHFQKTNKEVKTINFIYGITVISLGMISLFFTIKSIVVIIDPEYLSILIG